MKSVARSALLPYSTQQMFDVVNNVEAYPDFLPWCESSEVLEASEKSLTARLCIAKGGVKQSFVTRNDLNPPDHMHLQLVEGPFRILEGDWQFKPLGDDGCRIEMNLRFEMDSGHYE